MARYLRWGIAALVAAAFAWTIWKAALELSATPFDWRRLGWLELLVSAACYGVALTCAARMWHRILLSMRVEVPFLQAAWAFAASQLAKYVPGKAMVLVVRCGLLCGRSVPGAPGQEAGAGATSSSFSSARLGPVIASTFMETLMWVLVGAQLGCVGLLFRPGISTELFWGAVAVMCCFGLMTLPPIFSRGIHLAARLKQSKNWDQQKFKLDWLTYARAWLWSFFGWLWYGAAMYAVISAVSVEPVGWELYGLALTAICLATVGGFVSMLPGGLGVRELVMLPLLSGTLGTSGALLAAILMRLVCIAVELLLSAICHRLLQPPSQSPETRAG